MNILLFGSTYNPVHYAHINNINIACDEYDFNKVIIIPNMFAHFKNDTEVIDIKDRLNMLELALKYLNNNINYQIDYTEINSLKKLYTYDVVKSISTKYDAKLFFLIGSDQYEQLDKWYKIKQLEQIVQFIVVKRSEDILVNDKYLFINNDIIDNSSTSIRNEYKSSGIKEVDQYIRKKGLYLNNILKNNLSNKRYIHCLNVASLAKQKAKLFRLNEDKAYVAGLLHDITKEMSVLKQKQMLKKNTYYFELNEATIHQYSACYFVKKVLKIEDEEILSAISKHTTANFSMNALDKLIYCADMLEKDREFEGIAILREQFNIDLDLCFKNCFKHSYDYLIAKKIKISNELYKLNEMNERNEL